MNFKMTDKLYDTLKWIVCYLLPGLQVLYFALSKLWPLPYAAEVVGTIAAVQAFLAGLLGISTANYKAELALSPTIKAESEDDD